MHDASKRASMYALLGYTVEDKAAFFHDHLV